MVGACGAALLGFPARGRRIYGTQQPAAGHPATLCQEMAQLFAREAGTSTQGRRPLAGNEPPNNGPRPKNAFSAGAACRPSRRPDSNSVFSWLNPNSAPGCWNAGTRQRPRNVNGSWTGGNSSARTSNLRQAIPAASLQPWHAAGGGHTSCSSTRRMPSMISPMKPPMTGSSFSSAERPLV